MGKGTYCLLVVLMLMLAPIVQAAVDVRHAPDPRSLSGPEAPSAVALPAPDAGRALSGLSGFFTENLGQKGEGAGAFYCQGEDVSVAVGSGWLAYNLVDRSEARGHLVRVALVGASGAGPAGVGPSDHPSNFFLGSDPAGWVRGARNYREVLCPDVYDGIDLRLSITPEGLKYDFIVWPGASPDEIAMRYDGADRVWIEGTSGDLMVGTSAGVLRDAAPVSFQGPEGARAIVPTAYRFIDQSTVGFHASGYDASLPLVIDPKLSFSTLIGGSSGDQMNGICMDANDGSYVLSGQTNSDDFPTTPGAYDTVYDSAEAVVLRMMWNGTKLLFSTFLGGKGTDQVNNVTLDPQGRIYVIGVTASSDFPTTAGALYTKFRGGANDAFIARLSSNGSSLQLGTYFGGNGRENPFYIDVGADDVLTIAGGSESTDLPAAAGCYDTTANGQWDLFVAKLDADATGVTCLTYLGGAQADQFPRIQVAGDGSIIVAGQTKSNDFPVTGDAYQKRRKGDCDVVLSRLSGNLSALLYSTHFGGSGYEVAYNILLLGNGSLVMYGTTDSPDDFPLTPGCYDSVYNWTEGFVTMFNAEFSSLEYSTFFGGNWTDEIVFLKVEEDGQLLMALSTDSDELPAPDSMFAGWNDIYLCRLDIAKGKITAGTFIAGSGSQVPAKAIANDDGTITVLGNTNSPDFPTTPGAYSRTLMGGADAVLFKTTVDEIAGTVPSEPANVTAKAGDQMVNLTWDPPEDLGGVGLRGYILYHGDSPANHTVVELGPGERSYVDRDVENGKTYYYSMLAWNWFGRGKLSQMVSARPLGVPGAPVGFNATAMCGSVFVFWEPPIYSGGSPVLGYRLLRGHDAVDLRPCADLGDVRNFTDAPLEKGVRVYYRLMAFNAIGNGSATDVVSAVPTGMPSEPTGLRVVATDGQCLVEWSPPIDSGGLPLLGFRLYRGPTAEDLSVLASLDQIARSYRDTAVVNGETYFYAVLAFNGNGDGLLTSPVSGLPAGLPGAPVGFTATAGNGMITLAWTAPERTGGLPLLGYHVLKGLAEDKLFWLMDVTNLSYTDTGLIMGMTVYYRVQAFNTVGDGPMSEVRWATPISLPGAPKDLTAVPGIGQVTLAWLPPSDTGGAPIKAYRLYRGTRSDGLLLAKEFSSFTTGYPDRDLAINVTLYYAMTAVTDAGEGPMCKYIAATPYGLPGPPRGLNATAGDGAVDLSWEAPESDGGLPVSGYVLLRGPSATGLQDLVQLGAVLSYRDNTTSNGVTYYYAVSAVSGAGRGDASVPVGATPQKPPTAPGKVKTLVVEAKGKEVLLVWLPPDSDGGSQVTGYVVLRGLSRNTLAEVARLGPVTTWTDTDVEPGKTYFYSVSAINGVGTGEAFASGEVDVPKAKEKGPGFELPAAALAMLAVASALLMGRRRRAWEGWS